jgi:hypothetical protein
VRLMQKENMPLHPAELQAASGSSSSGAFSGFRFRVETSASRCKSSTAAMIGARLKTAIRRMSSRASVDPKTSNRVSTERRGEHKGRG